MKKLLIFSCILILPCISNAQCNDVKLLVKEYKNNKYKSLASNAATKVLLTQILKQIAGKSAGIITGIVNPSTINTPYDAFIASLERICKISNERPFDWESFNLELENLQ